ncbi:MAG: CPBP family intramembrane glutamic endopeptidase [Candidatus Eiseniibacteriota bacterium]
MNPPLDWSELVRTPAAIALTLAVAVLYPLLGYRRFLQIERLPLPLPTQIKLRLYLNVVVSQWTLVLATWLVLRGAGRDLGDVGLAVPALGHAALVSLALLAGFALLSRTTLAQLARTPVAELPEHVRRAGRILPGTPVEQMAFVAVAITAGVCEEILYRGWLPHALAGWTGSLPSGFALAACAFGIGHAYQGRNGVILTFVLALFLGFVAWWTKSLVPGQLLHVAIDLVNGIAVGAALRRNLVAPEPPVAADDAAAANDAPARDSGPASDVDPSPSPPA